MKKIVMALVLSVFMGLLLYSHSHAQWLMGVDGGPQVDVIQSIQPTPDGGFVGAGYKTSSGAGDRDYWVIKFNPDRTIAWEYTYGGTGQDYANSIAVSVDGGYVGSGVSRSFYDSIANIWVLKLNSDGSIAWQNNYNSSEAVPYSIRQTSDGGYILSGVNDGLFLMKLNGDGSLGWANKYPGISALSVQETSDAGFIAVGYGSGGTSLDAMVIRLASGGSVLWQNSYGGDGEETGLSIAETQDDGFIFSGKTTSFGSGGEDFWVVKMDDTGGILWQKAYGGTGNEEARKIFQTADGSYLAIGYTTSFGDGDLDFWVLKLDGSGNIQKQMVYDTNQLDAPSEFDLASATPEGNFLVTGYSGTDTWIMQLNGDGEIPDCSYMHETNLALTETTGVSTTITSTITLFDGSRSSTNISPLETESVAYSLCPITTHIITTSAEPSGTISPSGPVSVPQGGSQSFDITPDTGYQIADVLVDGVSVGPVPSYLFSDVQADHSISASFTLVTLANFTITTSAGPNGTISPSGPVSVPQGGSQSFDITSDTGYQIADVLVDGVSVGPVPSYLFSDVQADHSISAFFTIIPAQTGTISGRVTEKASGELLSGIRVDVVDYYSNALIGSITTDGQNPYNVTVPAGSYKVFFDSANISRMYLSQYHSDKRTFEGADEVVVTINGTTPNIDARLELGGLIEGQIKDKYGNGMAGVTVNIISMDKGNPIGGPSTLTGDNGVYSVLVPAGKWVVQAFPPCETNDYYHPKFYPAGIYHHEATEVTVSQNATVSESQTLSAGSR